ncbi:rolling circle replication-associated protein [Elizabethkingia meningoseptica]|uniref:rolling circle replication-associated protein n=1 Tax=Elizabethkingia meningoseptica TaxID=238 RepID=UPI003891D420
MYYSLSRVGLTHIKKKRINSQFAGSSVLSCWNNNIFKREINNKTDDSIKKQIEKKEPSIKKEKNKNYSLKKSKIRNKLLNFFHLKASEKFCAFYSISFPLNLPDDLCYRLLNTWLTRCRKSAGLKSYLWVAERQKNNTLHFHLITNNRMDIRTVNTFMAISLDNERKKGCTLISSSIVATYNGVDVDNLYYSKRQKNQKNKLNKSESQRKLMMYVSKYVTKNDTTSKRLPWHCSRDISALFVSINYQDISTHEIAQLIADNPDAVFTYDEEYFTYYHFLFPPDNEYYLSLDNVNNMIYERYWENKHLN